MTQQVYVANHIVDSNSICISVHSTYEKLIDSLNRYCNSIPYIREYIIELDEGDTSGFVTINYYAGGEDSCIDIRLVNID